MRFGEFELDEANALLSRGGRAIDLPPTPFGLLCALVRHPGSLLTKHTLMDAVLGHEFASDSVLKTAIIDLRSVLMDDPREPRYIEMVVRRGYRFIARPAARRKPNATFSGMHTAEFFQTDASINQGNSSGSMFNLNGEVRGIVSHILSPSGGSDGLGFAAGESRQRSAMKNCFLAAM